jgi:predicted acetyltransferase
VHGDWWAVAAGRDRPIRKRTMTGNIGAPSAATNGLDRVLITCRDDNVASARVIEHNGGLLENVRGTGSGRMRRYWVMLA